MTSEQLWNAFAALPDRQILASMPPSWKATASAAPAPRRGKRVASFFLDNGWVAAVLSAVVAIGVIVAIVLAGRENPVVPPVGTVEGSESETVTAPSHPESDTDNESASESDTATETDTTVETVPEDDGNSVTVPLEVSVADDGTPLETPRVLSLRLTPLELSSSPSPDSVSPVGMRWEMVGEDGRILASRDLPGYYTVYSAEVNGKTVYVYTGFSPASDGMTELSYGLVFTSLMDGAWRMLPSPDFSLTFNFSGEGSATADAGDLLRLRGRFAKWLNDLSELKVLLTSDPYLTDYVEGCSEDQLLNDILYDYWKSATVNKIAEEYDRLHGA